MAQSGDDLPPERARPASHEDRRLGFDLAHIHEITPVT